jgi:GNAT superfamily N-acetyltransferase
VQSISCTLLAREALRMSVEAGTVRRFKVKQGKTFFELLSWRVRQRLALGLATHAKRFGLRRDISLPLDPPQAKIPIEVRPLQPSDLPILLPVEPGMAHPDEIDEITIRRKFLQMFPQGCYVAVDLRDGTPCYMQWLLGPAQNDRIAELGDLPQLGPDEALLENAYTPPRHRGLGVMAAAMALIAEKAGDIGARHVLTFVGDGNIASLKGCQKAGFYPHMLHHRDRLLFGVIDRNRFAILGPDDPQRHQRF